MRQNPTLDTITDDLQHLFDFGVQNPDPKNVEKFLDDIKENVLRSIAEPSSKPPYLRMSNMGRPDRQLWYDINEPPAGEKTHPYSLRIKFLMGHMMEALILFLLKEAGHSVTDCQEEIEINGVKGHMDATIDGIPTDVKTASRYGMRKFESAETLREDDPFGYLAQISGYAKAKNSPIGAFLAIDKESGEIKVCTVSDNQMINPAERIEHVKDVLESPNPPARCYDPVPEGKSGNLGLAKGCTFCDHKEKCWADANDGQGLRKFAYSNGVKYLTRVVSTPNVPEI